MNSNAKVLEPLERRLLLSAYNPDPTFGDGGMATAAFANGSHFRAWLVTEVDSRNVLVVGTMSDNTSTAGLRLVMAQFDAETGALNEQFGNGGKLTSIEVSKVLDAQYLPDGKVAIIGGIFHASGGGGYDHFIARFTPAGKLDTTFSGDGIAELDFGGFGEGLVLSPLNWRLAEAPGGKLVIMGQVGPADTELPTKQTLLARFKSDGNLDKTFNDDGILLFANDAYWLANIAVQEDGGILMADTNGPGGVLRRFSSSGSVDTTFGESGVVTLPRTYCDSVSVMPDGRILTNVGNDGVARFTSSGHLDTSFGDRGIAPILVNSDLPETGFNFYVGPDGRITVLGLYGASRLTADGHPDPAFGVHGRINSEMGRTQSTLATNGDILIGGAGSSKLVLGRFEPQIGNSVLQSNGQLIISDTSQPDTITIDVIADEVRVDVNGTNTTYAVSDVTSIIIYADHGNDVISVNVPQVAVSVNGGEGNDSIVISGGGDSFVFAGAGSDTVITGAGNDLIHAEEGDVSVNSGDGNDTIWASMGNTVIDAGAGDDLIRSERLTQIDLGGNGTMLCDAGAGDDTVKAGSGRDTIRGGLGIDHIFAGDGDNLVYGGAGDDCIKAGAGSDTLWGEMGYDSVKAGLGDDLVNGGAGKDHLWGQQGNDRIYGRRNNDVLDGGPGEDRLVGGEGIDKFFGRDGNDVFFARDNDTETIDGGAGFDLCDWDDPVDELLSVEGY